MVESEPGSLLRFRHDRVQQAVFEAMPAERRRQLHLRLARRVMQLPALRHLAAEQYLPVVDAVTQDEERRDVARLFQRAAESSRVLNYVLAERFLAAAIGLIRPLAAGPEEAALLQHLDVERHVALYSLGRADDGDAVYAGLVARCEDPIDLSGPAGIQMYSLTHRARYPESMALGLALMSRLGLQQPDDLGPATADGLRRLVQWQQGVQKMQDFERAELQDPALLARARLSVQTANAAYFFDPARFAWLVLEAHALWVTHGPCPVLLASITGLPLLLAGPARNLRGAYEAGRHLMAVGQARGYRHAAAMAACIHGVAACHWVEPAEHTVAVLQQARADLLQAGDLAYASYTYIAADLLLDSAAALDVAAAEVQAALAFFERTGNAGFKPRYRIRQLMIQVLQGDTEVSALLDGPHEAPGATPMLLHFTRAVVAAVFGDAEALSREAGLAMQRLAEAPGYYLCATVHVLHGVALAEQARAAPAGERAALLEQLDQRCHAWLAARAADAPDNFQHLLQWLEAERAWAAGDVWAAGATFDRAIRDATRRTRPWHHALILERAARFQFALGMEEGARALLRQACAAYAAWGAAGKVRDMRRRHASLRGAGVAGLRPSDAGATGTIVAADAVDLMAVLKVSQALSSETQLDRLVEQLARVMGAMTGASHVQLLVRPDDAGTWCLAASLGGDAPAVSVEHAGARGDLALSVFRYALRTRQTLLLDDAVSDERFAGDPYFAALEQCSVLCAPIISHAEVRGMLMLENRQRCGAFGAERLDSLMLIAGQMSVSLNNALLYASLERKVAERTAALAEANRQLEQLSHTDALTGLANRRRFDEVLEAECRRAERTGLPLGLILVDIDFFKPYNDHYGHLGGDACLQRVAAVLATGRRRGGDLVARYGGEEFVILLPHTELQGVQTTAERVRAAVQALQEPHAGSPLGCVTVSLGVTSAQAGVGATAAQWVERADAALYEAKRGGRNRVGGAG